ncbi:TerD family protein [Rhodococcus sp. NPDC049939]|uniref:TerD family protein n=1 Tax=Rhodococcus sp. NPDC049939 TaxID=3155511 RepID=UPI0033FC9CB8
MPGQNTVLSTAALRFTADSATALDVSALIADSSLEALSSEHFVFYNQPHTPGVRLESGGVEIDLDAVHPDAHAVLCIASVDPDTTTGDAFSQVTATLHDHTGRSIAVIDIDCGAGESAVICWELYRRAGQWKLRAVGQGYRDGLAGLITQHGVDVNAADGPPTSPEVGSATEYAPIEPLDPDRIIERFGMIREDAARSAAALITARQFAQSRLDDELTAAVADPATRNSPAAAHARTRAQQRHDDVVEQARIRYDQDSAHLEKELDAISPMLPRPFADWNSPAWTSTTGAGGGTADGIRVGEVSAPQCGPLQIPMFLRFPLRQPLRIVGPDAPATAAVVSAVTLRMLAACDDSALDIVDLSGSLQPLTSALAHLPGSLTIDDAGDITSYLESVSASAELEMLDRADREPRRTPTRRLIVLNHFPYGYEQRHWSSIAFLAQYGPATGISLVIVSESSRPVAEIDSDLVRYSQALPAAAESEWRDPWTSNPWTFTPDRVPADSDHLAQVLAHFADR